jgi:two-component system, response regulator
MMENESIAVDILLVEDNPYDAEMTIRALRKKNLTNSLIHLKNGAEAIDFLFGTGTYEKRNTSQNPKVILLDLKMPKLDGIQVLSAIRKDERTREIPVVVLTSSREDPDIRECYRLGVNSYIVKPVDFDKFIDAVSLLGLYWLLLNQPPVGDR